MKKSPKKLAGARFEQSFLHVLSHQLRTPTYSIRNAIDILSSHKLPRKSKQVVMIARRKCNQLVNLLENLLKITDANIDRMITKKHKMISINSLIDGLVKSNKSEALKSDITFVIQHKDRGKKFYLSADKELLEQALQNLISNAVRYTKPNTKIIIRTKSSKHNFGISVIDKGCGIPPSEQKLIFAPFYRLQELHRKNPEGTGLGLSIAELFVKKMKGTIGVKSKKNVGSQFWIRLPAKEFKKGCYLVGGG